MSNNVCTKKPFVQQVQVVDATLDLIVMSSVFHCHQPHTIDAQLTLLMLTVANPVADVDPVDADVVAPIDDTNHRRIPHKKYKNIVIDVN